MNYRPTWDLSTIPTPALAAELGRRSAENRPLKCHPDAPDPNCERCKKRQQMRKWRAKGKK
jgi:Mg-chelatase subunit ChlI